MTIQTQTNLQERLAKAVCLFLAEMLRTRKTTLRRGAEIAAAIVTRLDQIQNETEFLKIIRELEYDFQELYQLEENLLFHQQMTSRQKMEKLVREFAIHCLPDNPEYAVLLMEEALKPECTLEELTNKFPDFAEFAAINEH